METSVIGTTFSLLKISNIGKIVVLKAGGPMNQFYRSSIFMITFIFSQLAHSAVNLNVKIGQIINNQFVEITKTISADYNKEIVIQDEGLKDKIVLSLKKFKNVLVNGNRIEPVQINVRRINPLKILVGKPQTITSFYKNEASFKLASNDSSQEKMELSLDFNEIN